MTNIFDQDLEKNSANYTPLSPVSFVERSAEIYGDLKSVIHGERHYTWTQTRQRTAQLSAALKANGIDRGKTVSVMLSNTPEMIEAHYAVPALGGVLNALNTRLDANLIAWQLNHCECVVLITDREYSLVMRNALEILDREHGRKPLVINVVDSEYKGSGDILSICEYEDWIAQYTPIEILGGPVDEWDAIAISYTSGTTGDPKGVVTHHRGAYLNAVSNAVTWNMPHFPTYLWTLPMFHCNGWCFPWTIAMLGGTHVCLRKVEGSSILSAIRIYGVDHYCAAPIVHTQIYTAPDELRLGITHNVRGMVAGASPPAAMIEGMAKIGFHITHVYGLTEVYGPAAVAVQRPNWKLEDLTEQARLNGRQGVRYVLQEGMTVRDPETMEEISPDGNEMGEIMFKGNIVMKGYLKNPSATQRAFSGGWFHTGDLAVIDQQKYVRIKDRNKDIIISGGENISSIEIEDALYKHESVMTCAVVAKPDPKWGETPVAYIETKPNTTATREQLIEHCKNLLASYKVPKDIRFEDIPKTSTGKIQKFELRQRIKNNLET